MYGRSGISLPDIDLFVQSPFGTIDIVGRFPVQIFLNPCHTDSVAGTTLQTHYALNHFREIVHYARRHNPFYRRWIADPENVPVLTRRTFLEHNYEILNGAHPTAETSGSTGIPIRLAVSAERQRLNEEDNRLFAGWLGGPIPTAYLIHPRSTAPGPGVLDVVSPLEDQIEFLLRERRERGIRGITTYPTNAERLSRAFLEDGQDTVWVERFGLFGEAIEDHIQPLVNKAFPNARIWSTYSSIEFGIIAGRCPYEPAFHHVAAHKLGVEILNAEGGPCREGEMGRIVITDYFNRITPFVRYDIGDLVEPGRCPCGRIHLPSIGKIYGKVYNTFLHRNGNRMVSYGLSARIKRVPGIIQFQVVQKELESFTVNVVASRTLDTEIAAEVIAYLGYRPEHLTCEYVDSIPRRPNGKFYAAICEIPEE